MSVDYSSRFLKKSGPHIYTFPRDIRKWFLMHKKHKNKPNTSTNPSPTGAGFHTGTGISKLRAKNEEILRKIDNFKERPSSINEKEMPCSFEHRGGNGNPNIKEAR